jgi:hypothetical protein
MHTVASICTLSNNGCSGTYILLYLFAHSPIMDAVAHVHLISESTDFVFILLAFTYLFVFILIITFIWFRLHLDRLRLFRLRSICLAQMSPSCLLPSSFLSSSEFVSTYFALFYLSFAFAYEPSSSFAFILFGLRTCLHPIYYRHLVHIIWLRFSLSRLNLICLAYLSPSYLLPSSFLSSSDFISFLAYVLFVLCLAYEPSSCFAFILFGLLNCLQSIFTVIWLISSGFVSSYFAIISFRL